MTKKKHESIVAQHAKKRLHQVTRARRKPYNNNLPKEGGFDWMNMVMQIIMIIVLIAMLMSIF